MTRRYRLALIGFLIGVALVMLLGYGCLSLVRSSAYRDAVYDGDTHELDRLIKTQPSLIDKQNPKGETGLHIAVERGHHESVRVLLIAGADVHADSPRCGLPLNYASVYGDIEMVKILVEEGSADIERQDRHSTGTALHYAATGGDFSIVEYLVEHGAEVNATTPRRGRPLYWAVFSQKNSLNREEVINYLLDHGAKFEVADVAGAVTEDELRKRAQELGLKNSTLERLIDRLQR